MAPVIAARAKTGSSYIQGIPTANSILETMKDFDNLWRGNLLYNSDRWARIKTAENRFQRPSVMPRKPRILSSKGGLPEPEIIIENGKSLNFLFLPEKITDTFQMMRTKKMKKPTKNSYERHGSLWLCRILQRCQPILKISHRKSPSRLTKAKRHSTAKIRSHHRLLL